MKKTLLVLSLTAVAGLTGGEMQIPDRWQPVKIAGKGYWVLLNPRDYVINDPAMMEMPLHRDAIWNIRRTSGNRIDFLGKCLKNPKLNDSLALLKTSNPLMINASCYYTEKEEDIAIPEASWQAFKKAAGNRLLGTKAAECMMSFNLSQKRYQLPDPKSRRDAYEILRGTYTCKTMSQFRDLSVFYNWGLPRYSGTPVYFDHMLLEFGAQASGHETGCGFGDMPMQFAVSRGAARQYGTFFFSVNATHNRSLRYPGQKVIWPNFRNYSHRDYNFLTPDERRTSYRAPRLTGYKPKPWHIFSNSGPECGIPDSEYRRRFIYAFFGGVGIYSDESNHWFMYALYDYKTINQADRLAVNLRDPKHYLSKTGELLADFYARIASKIDRGGVCTPIALVWDRYHGFGSLYASRPWNNRFPLPGDMMLVSLETYLFPSSPRTHEKLCHRTSPFGDIFDVITNDASQEAINAYPALLLTGDVSMDRGFGDRLIRYVRNGGTLIASRCQLKDLAGLPAIPSKPGVAEIAFGKGRLIVASQDYWLNKEKISDDLGQVIRKIAAEQLPVTVEGDIQYLVNRTRDGVIVSLYNNYGCGLDRTWENPDPAPDPKETQKVIITLKNPASEICELLSGTPLKITDRRIETSVVGGDVQVIRITLKKNK